MDPSRVASHDGPRRRAREPGPVTAPGFRPDLHLADRVLDLSRPVLMGVVNANPDSFSDPGQRSLAAMVEQAAAMAEDGATIIDVGGQSGTTKVAEVDPSVEIDRVLPVVEAIASDLPGTVISVDTYKPPVAAAVLAAGAHIINDVSGLRAPDLAPLVAAHAAALVVMHTAAAAMAELLVLDAPPDVVDGGEAEPHEVERVQYSHRCRQPHSERAGIAAVGVEHRDRDSVAEVGGAPGDPAAQRGGRASRHNIEQPGPCAGQVHDAGRERRRPAGVRGLERGLIHTDRVHPGEPARVADERGAVLADRGHHRRPTDPEVGGDLRDRVPLPADPLTRMAAGAFGQHRPRPDLLPSL